MVKGRLPIFLASLSAWMGAGAAIAQEVVSASPDVTIEIGGAVASDHDVAVDDPFGIVVLEDLGPIPEASDVVALGLDLDGDLLVAFDTTTLLSGGVVARPGDVVRYDGVAHSIEFDAAKAGLPDGVLTDATSHAPDGLLLSFDCTVDLGAGLVVADEDLVGWDGSVFSLVFDGSAEGLDSALDVDAAHDAGGGALLLSFDTTGQVGGIVFDDEDLVRFDGSSWSLEFDASAADSDWASADLDAVLVPEPGQPWMLGAGCALLIGLARRRAVSGLRTPTCRGRFAVAGWSARPAASSRSWRRCG